MNRYLIALTALLIFAMPLCMPAIAQDQQAVQPEVSNTESDTSTAADTTVNNKDQEDKDRKEKEDIERKARAEAEKRERVEDRQRRHEHDHYDGSPNNESKGLGLGFFGNSLERSSVSLLVAPSSRIDKAAVGLQWIGRQKFGIALWSSGDIDQDDDDVIDATIPHNDFYVENKKACYSIEGLYCLGTDRSMLILGVGLAIEETTYTDVSNVTGWKWKGGEDYSTRPAAQIGYRAVIAQRIGIQFGYDTSQYEYFGLTASF